MLLKYSFQKVLNIIERPIIVLLYHRVADIGFDPQLLSVSINNFREQLLFIKNNYEIFRFEDDYVKRNQPAIIITFDDGYADNYQNALPILEELEIPATFFITTGMIDSDREFWWDDLERLILIPLELPPKIELEIKGEQHIWDLSINNSNITDKAWNVLSKYEPSFRCQFYKDLHILLKPLGYQERNDILSELAEKTNQQKLGRETHRSLSREELTLLNTSEYASIGAHTVTHPQLSGLNFKEQEKEITNSKETLEKWLNRPISVFSYPFGGEADYNSDSVAICQKLEFLKVVTTSPYNYYSWTDSMQIPRKIVRNWDKDSFKKQILFNQN